MAQAAVVADSSALIALHLIGRLALLRSVFGELIVPGAVAREVTPTIASLPPLIHLRPVREPVDMRIVTANLGAGETEVLRLGLEIPATWLILDDGRARRLARGLGLSTLGTAAVVLEAKRLGHVSAVRPLLDALLATGFRLVTKKRPRGFLPGAVERRAASG